MTTVILDSSQADLIISTIVVCTCCLAFCLGWLSHEFGGK